MKNYFKFLAIAAIVMFLSACTKETIVVPAGSTTYAPTNIDNSDNSVTIDSSNNSTNFYWDFDYNFDYDLNYNVDVDILIEGDEIYYGGDSITNIQINDNSVTYNIDGNYYDVEVGENGWFQIGDNHYQTCIVECYTCPTGLDTVLVDPSKVWLTQTTTETSALYDYVADETGEDAFSGDTTRINMSHRFGKDSPNFGSYERIGENLYQSHSLLSGETVEFQVLPNNGIELSEPLSVILGENTDIFAEFLVRPSDLNGPAGYFPEWDEKVTYPMKIGGVTLGELDNGKRRGLYLTWTYQVNENCTHMTNPLLGYRVVNKLNADGSDVMVRNYGYPLDHPDAYFPAKDYHLWMIQ